MSNSCDPMDCSLPDSSVHGILQARTLEWVAIFFSRWSSCSRDRAHISCISCFVDGVITHWAAWGKPCPWPWGVLLSPFTVSCSGPQGTCPTVAAVPEGVKKPLKLASGVPEISVIPGWYHNKGWYEFWFIR